jgi:hypothetical protein
MGALRARDALAKFDAALPGKISKFDDALVQKLTQLLNELRKQHADAIPFAITLIARRLKAPWQLIRLATKAAPSKNAADIAATPYAIAVAMVLDRVDDNRAALRVALKNNRVLIARALLTEIYDTEYALQVRIDQFEQVGRAAAAAHGRDRSAGGRRDQPLSRGRRPRAGLAQPAQP